jgi:hypothetical protein
VVSEQLHLKEVKMRLVSQVQVELVMSFHLLSHQVFLVLEALVLLELKHLTSQSMSLVSVEQVALELQLQLFLEKLMQQVSQEQVELELFSLGLL